MELEEDVDLHTQLVHGAICRNRERSLMNGIILADIENLVQDVSERIPEMTTKLHDELHY